MPSERDRLLKRLKESTKEISSYSEVTIDYNGFAIIKQLHPSYIQKETYTGAISLATSVTTVANRHLALYINPNGQLQFTSGDLCSFATPEDLFDAIDLFLVKNIDTEQKDFYPFLRAEAEVKFPAFKSYSDKKVD